MNFLEVVRNIVAALDGLGVLFSAICFLIGAFMCIFALLQAQRRHALGPGDGSWGKPVSTFVTAVMFMALPQLITVLNTSVFGTGPVSAQSILAYAPSTVGRLGTGTAREMLIGITAIIQFMGLFAVARGLLLLNQSAQGGPGPRTFGPGFTFIAAGICATNFPIIVGIMEDIITP